MIAETTPNPQAAAPDTGDAGVIGDVAEHRARLAQLAPANYAPGHTLLGDRARAAHAAQEAAVAASQAKRFQSEEAWARERAIDLAGTLLGVETGERDWTLVETSDDPYRDDEPSFRLEATIDALRFAVWATPSVHTASLRLVTACATCLKPIDFPIALDARHYGGDALAELGRQLAVVAEGDLRCDEHRPARPRHQPAPPPPSLEQRLHDVLVEVIHDVLDAREGSA